MTSSLSAMHADEPAPLQIRAVIQPLAPQKAYSSCPRNSIRSRAWGTASEGCSYRVSGLLMRARRCPQPILLCRSSRRILRPDTIFLSQSLTCSWLKCLTDTRRSSPSDRPLLDVQVERCILVSKNGTQTELEPSPDGAATVVPTFAPAQHERAMNTRSASAAHDRRARTVQVPCLAPLQQRDSLLLCTQLGCTGCLLQIHLSRGKTSMQAGAVLFMRLSTSCAFQQPL